MTNGVNQSNPYFLDEEANKCLPEPEVLESIDPSVIDVEPLESSPVSTSLPPEEIPAETASSGYETAPERTLRSIAPNTPRTPHAVKIHQTIRRDGRDTVLTAHVGVEDYAAAESRPVYDAVVRQRGRGSRARIVSAGFENHETGTSVALSRGDMQPVRTRREVSVDDLFVSVEEVPTPVMVVRAMMRGPEEVRRLETPEERIERSADALVAGCCALCGECVEGEGAEAPVDLTTSNPPENPADQAAAVGSADSSSPPTELTTIATSSPVQTAVPPAETPVVVAAEQTRQAQEATGQTADTPPPAIRSSSTIVRSTAESASFDGYSGDGPVDGGTHFGSEAPWVGAAYAAAIGSPGLVLGTGGPTRATSRGTRAATPSGQSATAATVLAGRQAGVSDRAESIQVEDGQVTGGAPVGVESLIPRVGQDTTIAAVQARQRGGVVPEFPRPGDTGGHPVLVARFSQTGAEQPEIKPSGRSVANHWETVSPEYLAALAVNAVAADEARVIDPSEAASVVSPQAAFLAHQASGMASRPVQVDSREQDGVVARQDAELNTVSDRTQLGTQTGGQDARQGTSDPLIVASNEVEGDEVLEGELVDENFDDISRWNPLGNAQVAADIIV